MDLPRGALGCSEKGKPAVLMVCVTETAQETAAPWGFSAELALAVSEAETQTALGFGFGEH